MRITVVAAVAALSVATSLSAAFGAPDDHGPDLSGGASKQPGRSTVAIATGGSNPYGDVPLTTYKLVTALDKDLQGLSFVWDNSTRKVTVWTSSPEQAKAVDGVLAAASAADVIVAVSTYPRSELERAASGILEAGAVGGVDVAWAAPRPDGSGLDVGATSTSGVRSAVPLEYGGIPVEVIAGGEAEAASRDVDYSPFVAGADMVHRIDANYVGFCTSAFAFNHFDLATRTVQERMFTADHCIHTGDSVWHTGRNLANAELGTNALAVSEQNDIAAIGGQDYDPYLYWGPNTSNSVAAIFGYVTPIVGASVCYSGAPSGTVCYNTITHTEVQINYQLADGPHTYYGLTRTVQDTGISAVGNGDSGGPAVVIATGGYPYAIGIISGMQNAGSSCQGDPSSDNRQCSATAFFAPVANYFKLAANELDSIQTY